MFRGTVIKACKDEKGAVAATYAIALIGLIAIAGVAFDYGRLVAIDSELQNGADQAALAGATQLDGEGCGRRVPALATAQSPPRRTCLLNKTVLANDGGGNAITLVHQRTGCDATGSSGSTRQPTVRRRQQPTRRPNSSKCSVNAAYRPLCTYPGGRRLRSGRIAAQARWRDGLGDLQGRRR